jgi:hypothetical protein
MFEKPGREETAYLRVWQGPAGKVKAGLLESQCPKCNRIIPEEQREAHGAWATEPAGG